MLVASGKYSRKLPRSTLMSPGSFPKKDTPLPDWINRPVITRRIPMIMRIFPIFQVHYTVHDKQREIVFDSKYNCGEYSG
jgi:hypothetical protein